MPRFYEVTNNNAPEDEPKVNAEVQAITFYLFEVSTPPENFVDPPQGDAEKGKALFLQKGCLACHSHRPYTRDDIPRSLLGPETKVNPGPDPASTYDLAAFPDTPVAREYARKYGRANFGPNLVNIAAK